MVTFLVIHADGVQKGFGVRHRRGAWIRSKNGGAVVRREPVCVHEVGHPIGEHCDAWSSVGHCRDIAGGPGRAGDVEIAEGLYMVVVDSSGEYAYGSTVPHGPVMRSGQHVHGFGEQSAHPYP